MGVTPKETNIGGFFICRYKIPHVCIQSRMWSNKNSSHDCLVFYLLFKWNLKHCMLFSEIFFENCLVGIYYCKKSVQRI